ncbi:hypothetical protein CUMW_081890 [Citrus unshiu]|nr:hypothetical protein CUMW_081890 [Citrus unshiu]
MRILLKAFVLFIWLLCSSNNSYANDNDLSHSYTVSVTSLLHQLFATAPTQLWPKPSECKMWILSKAFLLFICLLCSSNNGAYADDNDLSHSHIVSVSSLLPPNVCNRTRTALPQGNCNSKECPFNIQYADGSGSGGFWATDRITIQEANSNGYFTRYPFLLGCINNSSGDKSGASGIMGLDRSPVSIITRTNTSYFSYCLPSPYGSTGYITFGKTDTVNSKFIKYTPIVTTSEQSEFYDIILTGISVGGKKLPFNTSYFTKFGAIIDSGNIITRLPPPIYAALRSAFHKRMKKYKKAKGLEDLLDTCYDLSAYETVVVPKIAIHFLGGVDLELDVED